MQISLKQSSQKQQNGSSLAGMLAKREQQKAQEMQQAKDRELLKQPRSKAYLECLAKYTGLLKDYKNVEMEIDHYSTNIEAVLYAYPELEQYYQPDWWEKTVSAPLQQCEDASSVNRSEKSLQEEVPHKPKWWEVEEASETSQDRFVPKWNSLPVQDVKSYLQEIQKYEEEIKRAGRERERLVQEIVKAQEEFLATLPVRDKFLRFIYPDWSEEVLIKYGVLAYSGKSFSDAQELLEVAGPLSKEEEAQLIKGYEVYSEYYCQELLMTEIHRDVICVVYQDGRTVVVE